MAYTVLANRYRPRTFDEVVGQEDTARVLRTALATGRAGHAFLFSGPRGVGKTSMARILAKALDCLANDRGEPCGTCSVCRAIDAGSGCLDVAEIDGASHNKVENVRELIEGLRFRPVEARYRITIVDEVHMLSTAAFNALLKTLEEPPAHAKFILATTEPLKVPETIRSRCQMYDFRRLLAPDIEGRLQAVCEAEGVPVPPGLLARLARHAQGGLRDALSLLDQLITFGEGSPTLEDFERLTGRLPPELLEGLIQGALDGDGAAAHRAGAEALARGARPADLVAQLTELLEGLLVTAAGGEPADRTEAEREALARLAGGADVDRLLAMLDVLVEAAQRLRQRLDGRLVVEMAILTLARLPALQSVADLLAGAPPPAVQAHGDPPVAGGTGSSAAPAAGARRSRAEPAPRRAPVGQRGPPRVGPQGDPPAAATRSPGPAAAPSGGPAGGDDFRSRFLAAVGSRALRLELVRYGDIRLEADGVVLVPPGEGPSPLYDPASPEVMAALRAAAASAAGAQVEVRLAGGGPTPGGPPGATATPGGAPGATAAASGARKPVRGGGSSGGGVAGRIREAWPGAEQVDG